MMLWDPLLPSLSQLRLEQSLPVACQADGPIDNCCDFWGRLWNVTQQIKSKPRIIPVAEEPTLRPPIVCAFIAVTVTSFGHHKHHREPSGD